MRGVGGNYKSNMNRTARNIIITLIFFFIYFIAFEYFEKIMLFIDRGLNFRLLSYFFTYIIIGLPIFIGTYFVNDNNRIFKNLGLLQNILHGIVLASIFSFPMFIGGFIFYKISDNISIPNLIAKTIFAGFFEELYFRGFLFGQIFKNTKLGFIPSIIICALVFATGHLWQSQNISILIGVFITTFLGAIFFAWLFVEWNYNLWVPIFLHTLMNLSWYIFNVSDNALGNVNSNIFRGLTIAFSIIITILYKRKSGRNLMINRKTLMIKK
jgi:uncharacterized protein